jgi:DNA-binding NarL/FixJ family response regulator
MKTALPPSANPERPRLRLLIVDDTPRVLRDLRQLLELTGGIEIVGEAGNGLEALRLARSLSPDAVVMDLEMPVLDGYAATRLIKTLQPAPRVIILSVHADPDERQRAREAGADSFVVKGARYETLMNAILGKKVE